jgi:antitoxin YefM
MRSVNYTDLRNNLKNYIDSVIENGDTVIINRNGGNGAVLMSLDHYNSLEETEYIMSSPEMMKRLRDAENSMNAGKGTKVNIADL